MPRLLTYQMHQYSYKNLHQKNVLTLCSILWHSITRRASMHPWSCIDYWYSLVSLSIPSLLLSHLKSVCQGILNQPRSYVLSLSLRFFLPNNFLFFCLWVCFSTPVFQALSTCHATKSQLQHTFAITSQSSGWITNTKHRKSLVV